MSARLLRLGGGAALSGGLLLLMSDLLVLLESHKDLATTISAFEYNLHGALALIAGVLVLFGVVGLYAAQALRAGIFGVAGFALAFIATALAYGVIWDATFAVPSLVHASHDVLRPETLPGPYDFGITLTFWALAVGWVAFAVSMLSARVYPRTAATLLAVGAVFFVCPVPPTAFIGVIVEHVELACALPLTHIAVTAGTVLWDVALTWLGFMLLTGISLKPKVIHPSA